MVGPCCGVPAAHLQDVFGHGVYCGVWVAHDVVEEAEGSYMVCGLHRKFRTENTEQEWEMPCLALENLSISSYGRFLEL